MKIAKMIVPFLIAVAITSAEPITLQNKQATELLSNLLKIDSGLTAANSTIIARDINALRPVVDAYQKGNNDARIKYKITASTPTDKPDAINFLAEITANGDAPISVDLTRITISDDELVATKMTPAMQSCLLLYLSPVTPAAKK
jgi:hypothetical protein